MMRTYDDGVVETEGLYDFVYGPEGDEMHIRIIKGEWSDLVFRFGKVGFTEDEDAGPESEDSPLTLAFDYDIIDLPSHLDNIDESVDDEKFYEFENMLGDILVDIFEKELEIKKPDEHGTTNTEASIH
jgi:hypothetical protein